MTAGTRTDHRSDMEARDRLAQARRLVELGKEKQRGGDPQGALECQERALSIMAGYGQHPFVADILYWMGTVHRELGQTAQAEALYQRSLEAALWTGSLDGEPYAVNGLAAVAQRRGEVRLAEGLYRRAARLAAEITGHRMIGLVEQNLGILANAQGDLAGALVHYRRSLEALEQARDSEAVSWVLSHLGTLQVDLGLVDEARESLARGVAIAKERRDRALECLFELARAEVFIAQEDWQLAREACGRAEEIVDERGDALGRAETLKLRAVIARETGSADEAIRLLDNAHVLAVEGEDAFLDAEVLVEMGEAFRVGGQANKARAFWEAAIARFRVLNATQDAATTQARIAGLNGGGP